MQKKKEKLKKRMKRQKGKKLVFHFTRKHLAVSKMRGLGNYTWKKEKKERWKQTNRKEATMVAIQYE